MYNCVNVLKELSLSICICTCMYQHKAGYHRSSVNKFDLLPQVTCRLQVLVPKTLERRDPFDQFPLASMRWLYVRNLHRKLSNHRAQTCLDKGTRRDRSGPGSGVACFRVRFQVLGQTAQCWRLWKACPALHPSHRTHSCSLPPNYRRGKS
jgi:hypothetical protein